MRRTTTPAASTWPPPDRTAHRVALVQAQARPTLLAAACFAVAAPVAAVVPHDTGAWLPLHLLLVGALLSAISGATQLLAVTWSAAPAPGDATATVQRWSVVVGAVGVAAGRELDVDALTGAGALLVGFALVLLAVILLRIRQQSTVDRYHPAIEAYLAAVGFGVVGIAMGATLAAGDVGGWWVRMRAAHLAVNVLGLVGLVLAGTLPYFVATQARMKMSSKGGPTRVRASTGVLVASALLSAGGHLFDRPGVAGAGLLAYAAGLVAVGATLPRPGRRQLAWAGPRLLQLAAGCAWWLAMVVALAVVRFSDGADGPVLAALAIGGFAQILLASLAYFGPVLRGGGHQRLTAGFATTASWAGLALGNVVAFALLVEARTVAVAAGVLWALDTVWRGVRLLVDDGGVEPTR